MNHTAFVCTVLVSMINEQFYSSSMIFTKLFLISFPFTRLLLRQLHGLQFMIISNINFVSNWVEFQLTVNVSFGPHFYVELLDTENIKLVFCAVKDTIMQSALKEFNLAWNYRIFIYDFLDGSKMSSFRIRDKWILIRCIRIFLKLLPPISD